jgi:glycolate oxidase
MSFVWTIAEQHKGILKDVSFELLARGRSLADEVDTKLASVVIGYGVGQEELSRLIAGGADEVYSVQHPALEEFSCESYSAVLQNLIKTWNPSIILASATTQGRTLMPHVAVKVHTGLTADCTELAIEPGTDNLLQTRPAIGGNIMATIKTPDHRPQMATIRPKSNKVLKPDSSRVGQIIEVPVPESLLDSRVKIIGYREGNTGFVNLEEADIVVAGGRGFKKSENFSMLDEAAKRLGGVVGATRDAVDRGWISYPHQIGLSGKTISSRLYVGAGISGSIQHLAGIKTCETIVSINSDPEANLHKVADFAIVGDLFEVMPELIRQLGGKSSDLDIPQEKTSSQTEEKKIRTRTSASPYARVNKAHVEELKSIVGQGNVIVDEERLESYSHDETDASEYAVIPEVVVLPSTTEEVSKIMKLANRENIAVTPRGAGSGLSGGAIPCFGGILISVEKMNSLIELDVDNMVAEVEAGMITNEFAQEVQERGLFFAGYPMSLETCFIGGNIAENAGGGKAVKYGVTGRYIMGLEMVTPTGDIVRLGGKAPKDVSGYDLKQLIVGSEGTLGIVTKATIRLIGLPTVSADLLVLFDTPRQAIDAVPVIIKSGIVPTGLEFMDRLSAQTSCRYLNESLPYGEAGAMLLIELDGNNSKQVEADLLAVGELCMQSSATKVFVAEDSNTKERIWNVRRNVAEAFKVFSPVQSLEDIVVPTSRIPELIPELERVSQKYGMLIPCYGHAGDGNLHATLVKDPEMAMESWKVNEDAALKEIYRITMGFGGKISGEHGIGLKRKSYLKDLIDPVELDLMRGIKKAWDPKNILNPGKIFD